VARIRVSTVIDAPPKVVWAAVEDIATHVDWMGDAVAIRFTSAQRSGVGTTFDCDTKVGPIRLTDRMEITEWAPRSAMGVRHVGVVTGTGTFTLKRLRGNRTRFTWRETLRFPWWLGGPIGAVVGGPVMKRIWRANLERLRARVESGRAEK
jgi:uncharacterized protein YndB with AHSA1/START domain